MHSLSILIKPASSSCNLKCKYCFYDDISSHREVKNYGYMSLETLEILVKKAFEEARSFCAFNFQGGEPTLRGLDFFETFIEFTKKYNKHKINTLFSLQTNGILIDEKWAEFLSKNNFLTGISLDCDKDIHDLFRIDNEGNGSFTKVLKAIRILKNKEAEFNILMVLTKAAASHPTKIFNFIKKNNMEYIQIIPCIAPLDSIMDKNEYHLSDIDYGNFLCRFFDLWYSHLMKGKYISVRNFDNYVKMLQGKAPESCALSGRCASYATVEADGSIYPCDFYVLDKYRLGSIKEDGFESLLKSEIAKDFCKLSHIIPEKCKECTWYPICRNGCFRDRQGDNLNRYCKGYGLFFEHCIKRLEEVAKIYI